MTIYLVGRWIEDSDRFAIVGLFSENPKAADACRDDSYFVLDFTLDERLPDEIETRTPWHPTATGR